MEAFLRPVLLVLVFVLTLANGQYGGGRVPRGRGPQHGGDGGRGPQYGGPGPQYQDPGPYGPPPQFDDRRNPQEQYFRHAPENDTPQKPPPPPKDEYQDPPSNDYQEPPHMMQQQGHLPRPRPQKQQQGPSYGPPTKSDYNGPSDQKREGQKSTGYKGDSSSKRRQPQYEDRQREAGGPYRGGGGGPRDHVGPWGSGYAPPFPINGPYGGGPYQQQRQQQRRRDDNYPRDTFDVYRVPPSANRRFAKYFPGPPECVCEYPPNRALKGLAPIKNNKRPVHRGDRKATDRQTGAKGYDHGTPHEPHLQDATQGRPFDHSLYKHTAKANSFKPLSECSRDTKDVTMPSGHVKSFIFTALDSNCQNMTWSEALDFCQSAGMQAVSLTKQKPREEVQTLLNTLNEKGSYGGMTSFWTSGHITHPKHLGDEIKVMWTSMTSSVTESVRRGESFWGDSGADGGPQPDNYSNSNNDAEEEENCAVALDSAYGERRVSVHDVVCWERHPVVCEERVSEDSMLDLFM